MRQTTKPNFAFIDSQNLNLGVQKVGWKMDWIKFRKYLKDQYGVDKAYMFIGYMPENVPMYEQLHDAGYLIVLKPTVGMFENSGSSELDESKAQQTKEEVKRSVKGNIDAELVLYSMKELPNYNQAVIVSGDGDFYCLAEYLAGKNRLKAILTPNWQYSTLLKPYEDKIVRLDHHRKELAYKDRGAKKRIYKKTKSKK